METAIAPEKIDIDRIIRIYKEQRNHKPAMVRLTAKERIARIKKIKQAMFDYREQIEDAMYRDFKSTRQKLMLQNSTLLLMMPIIP